MAFLPRRGGCLLGLCWALLGLQTTVSVRTVPGSRQLARGRAVASRSPWGYSAGAEMLRHATADIYTSSIRDNFPY